MTFNNILKWLDMAYEFSIRFTKLAIIIFGGLSVIIFIFFTVLYFPSFLQKKINLKQAENVMQQNLEIVEKATFFETSTKFNEMIENQMETIRGNAAKIKQQTAIISQQDNDIKNNPDLAKTDTKKDAKK